MKIYSDILTAADVAMALTKAKEDGFVDPAVTFDRLEPRGARKAKHCTEVALGVSGEESKNFIAPEVRSFLEDWGVDEKAIRRAARRYSRRGYGEVPEVLNLGATWHEWGHFIAHIFKQDPDAVVGDYDGAESFTWQTYEDPRVQDYGIEWNGRCYDFMADVI